MNTSPDCIPCLTRLAEETVKRVTTDKNIISKVTKKTISLIKEMDMTLPPPKMGQFIHRLVCEKTGIRDPFMKIKQKCNETILMLYPELKKQCGLQLTGLKQL